MRTINFRAKNRLNQWVYGVPCVYPEMKTDACMFNSYWTDDNGCLHETRFAIDDTNTIGQFTGLFDKNGKEIYEGDIVYSEFSYSSNSNCLIGWNEENSCFGLMDEYDYRSKLEGYDFPRFENAIFCNFRKHSRKFEVIGNIHDNPELLKGGER